MITQRFLGAFLVLCTGVCWSHGKGRITSEIGSICQIRENRVHAQLLFSKEVLFQFKGSSHNFETEKRLTPLALSVRVD